MSMQRDVQAMRQDVVDVQNALEGSATISYLVSDVAEQNEVLTQMTKQLTVLKEEIKEHKGYATISFLKDLGAYTPHFGDNDRLPTGNQLGVHWPENVDVDDQYDVRLLEVVRGSLDVAYELKVVGIACATTKACEKGLTDRWTSYSAERFYGAPLVWNASCTGGMLDFTAVDAFKRANKYRATYEVTERPTKRSDSVAGDFYFAAYWRETAVASVDVSSLVGPLLLTVTNEFGDATSVDVDTCT